MERLEIATHLLSALIAEPNWGAGEDGSINCGFYMRVTHDMEGCEDEDRFAVAALRMADTLLRWSERSVVVGEVTGGDDTDDATDLSSNDAPAVEVVVSDAPQAVWPFPPTPEYPTGIPGLRLVPIPIPDEDA